MVSKLKVGDKVRVREDLEVGMNYYSADGLVTESVTDQMARFAGQIVTIKSCPNSHEYHIEEDPEFWWVDEMFSEKVVVVATTDIKTQEYMIEHQFELPRKYCSIAERYPHVTWARAVKLYERAVRDVLEEHGVSDIFSGDLNFGRGLQKVDEKFRLYLGFENDLEFAAKEVKENKGDFEKKFTSLWIPSSDCYNCSQKDCGNCAYKDYKLAIT